MKKRTIAFVLAVLSCFMFTIGANAASFSVVGMTGSYLTLNDAMAYKTYTEDDPIDRITMADDSGITYTFKRPVYSVDGYSPGIWPGGLEITEDGKFYGTLTKSSYFASIKVLATASDGTKKLIKCRLSVQPRNIVARVRGGIYPYTGDVNSPYTAHAALYDAEDTSFTTPLDIDYTIQYGADASLTGVVDVGRYMLKVILPSDCNLKEQLGDPYIEVSAEDPPSLTVSDKEVKYDGQPHGLVKDEDIQLGISWDTAGVKVEYKPRGAASSEYTETEPSDIGVYDVRVYTTNTTFVQASATATLTIYEELVFSVSGYKNLTYNEANQAPTITADKSVDFSVSYRYTDNSGAASTLTEAVDAGTYVIAINLANPGAYKYKVVDADDQLTEVSSFEIAKKKIAFTIDPSKFSYTGEEQTPTVAVNPDGFTAFTAAYQKSGSEPLNTIKDMGTYDVIITLDDANNYAVDNENSTHVITVAENELEFTIEKSSLTQTYDGNAKAVTVTPSAYCDVVYKQGDAEVTEPINAGEYTVIIKPHDGYAVKTVTITAENETPVTLGENENATLTIEPKPVTITIVDGSNSVTYDGKPHEAEFTVDPVDFTDYKVTYTHKDNASITGSTATQAGVYDITIESANDNYVVKDFSGTFTIYDKVEMNIGNSPAAMVYLDELHAEETDENKAWREEALAKFKADKSFAEGYTPAKCYTGVVYGDINGTGLGFDDLDGSVYTCIVNDISAFNDPGVAINNVKAVFDESEVTIEQADASQKSMNGLYTVTYRISASKHNISADMTLTRYVMAVKQLGDVNGDGYVNAVDAAKLDAILNGTEAIDTEELIRSVDAAADEAKFTPNGVTQSRVWNVNKDGALTSDDADAIRSRFSEKIIPYYKWAK